MTSDRQSGRRRAVLAAGLLLGLSAMITAAVVSETVQVPIAFGHNLAFDVDVAGSEDLTWTPSDTDWQQGYPSAVPIGGGDRVELHRGDVEVYRVAVRNNSNLPAYITMRLIDPDPLGNQTDPVSGNPLELFDSLHFTARVGSVVVLSGGPGDDLTYTWPTEFDPGESRIVDITVLLPSDTPTEVGGATTGIHAAFYGENS